MKYIGMPLEIWLFFRKSFQRNLTAVFELTPTEAQAVMVESKGKYKEIIRKLPKFEKGKHFSINKNTIDLDSKVSNKTMDSKFSDNLRGCLSCRN